MSNDASQSQAVPSELASRLRAAAEDAMYADHAHVNKSTLMAAADEIDRLSHSAATGKVPEVLTADDVEWIVNDNAELGVKVGDQFFFLYKGGSLVYESGCHDNGEPMMYRRVFKREFGECAHPINYDDFSKIGTVSLGDSNEWKPIAASPAAPLAGKAEAVAAMNRAKALKVWDDIPHVLHVELDTIFKYLSAPLAAAVLAEEASDE